MKGNRARKQKKRRVWVADSLWEKLKSKLYIGPISLSLPHTRSDSSRCLLSLPYACPGSLAHSTPQITSPAFRLRLRQHSLIYINQSVKTCTAGICLWWKAIESCAGVLKSAEPIPEMFWHSWYLQKTYLRRGYNQPLVYESYGRISEDEWTLPQVLPPTRGERGIVTIASEPLNPKRGW